MSKFFFQKTIRSYVCVFFTGNPCCVLALLWFCFVLKMICCSWTCWLTSSDYHTSRFPQTRSEVLIKSTICEETSYFARCAPKVVIPASIVNYHKLQLLCFSFITIVFRWKKPSVLFKDHFLPETIRRPTSSKSLFGFIEVSDRFIHNRKHSKIISK